VKISIASRKYCVRAESSMPRQQIQVIRAIHTTAAMLMSSVFVDAAWSPNSRNV
jgi:hypothetical protein